MGDSLSFTDTLVAPLNMLTMTSQTLHPSFHFLGADVQSNARIPRSHSSQFDTPSMVKECGHVGCVHELHPELLGIPLNGALL